MGKISELLSDNRFNSLRWVGQTDEMKIEYLISLISQLKTEIESWVYVYEFQLQKSVSEAGRRGGDIGGRVNSPLQNAARRENGKKGGRPKKKLEYCNQYPVDVDLNI